MWRIGLWIDLEILAFGYWIELPKSEAENIHFYGFDDQGRHLETLDMDYLNKEEKCPVSSVAELAFHKGLVGGSIPSPGTKFRR